MRDPQKATPGGSGQAVAETNTESPHMVAAGACLDKQRHPLSAAFGDMPADEFAELVRDIKRNGQISDIVKAAEKCTASCIHPGTPWNMSEPGIEKLMARAAKFN